MNEATKSGHREHHIWGSVSYWRGAVASERGTADGVRVEVGFGLARRDFPFLLPNGELPREVADLIRALDFAVEAGDRHARAEIRACLGIREPRG
jgi:hypothetical protein